MRNRESGTRQVSSLLEVDFRQRILDQEFWQWRDAVV
jgi:hypothetical protein